MATDEQNKDQIISGLILAFVALLVALVISFIWYENELDATRLAQPSKQESSSVWAWP